MVLLMWKLFITTRGKIGTYIYCVFYVLEVHEAKTSWSSSLMIVYDLKVLDLSISLKDFTQVPLLGAEVETKDTKATAFPWIVLQSGRNVPLECSSVHSYWKKLIRNHWKLVHHRNVAPHKLHCIYHPCSNLGKLKSRIFNRYTWQLAINRGTLSLFLVS